MNAISLQISDIQIRVQDGRYCLNDLHKSSGGEKRHKPSEWLRNKQTVELIEEVEKAGITAIQSKQQVGTFAVKELVYAYAMWISAKFHLTVIRAYDALAAHQHRPKILPKILHPAPASKFTPNNLHTHRDNKGRFAPAPRQQPLPLQTPLRVTLGAGDVELSGRIVLDLGTGSAHAVKPGALTFTPDGLPQLVSDPGTIPLELLPAIIAACAQRLDSASHKLARQPRPDA